LRTCQPASQPPVPPPADPAAHRPDRRVGPLPRLQRLRDALIAEDYHLCSQKAELLTDFLKRVVPETPVADLLSAGHFQLARTAMAETYVDGRPQPRWKLALNARLEALYHRLHASRAHVPRVVWMAHGLHHVLAHAELRIYEDELIVGNCTRHRIGAALHPDYGGILLLPELRGLPTRAVNPIQATPAQLDRLENDILPYWFSRSVMTQAPALARDKALQNTLLRGREFVVTQFAGISHVTPDYEAVLRLGFRGLLDRVEAAAVGANQQQLAFLTAAAEVCRAMVHFGRRWEAHCRDEAARTEDPARAAELKELAELFAQVPAGPAQTFHQGLQAIFLTHVALHQESFQHGVSFGRLDQLLWPLFQADLAAGRLDESRAVELLGCLLGKAAEQVPLFNGLATRFFSGLSSASGITIGGCDADGRDQSNALTHLILAAVDRMRLRQPNIHLRWGPATAEDVLDHAAEVVGRGGGVPAFFNDLRVPLSIAGLGVPLDVAHDYSIVGCVEWGIPGRSFPAAGAGFVNLAAVLLDGWEREHDEIIDVDDLFAAFRRRLSRVVQAAVDANNAIETVHRRDRPTPLLSLVVDGCIERGADVTAGGAEFDSTGFQAVGLADVADSFAAVEQARADGWTMGRIRSALSSEDPRPLARLSSAVPRFGEDAGPAERWARRLADAWCAEVRRHRNPRTGPYAPGFWSMTTHVGFGEKTGTLPSGRKAGMPLANGLSPTNGADRRGPTAAMLSVAKVASAGIGNGYALNLALAPAFLSGKRGRRLLRALVEGYFREGGMQVQFNVLDVAQLLDARARPDRHRGLVVRVSGYSAYFVDLTPQMQDEIIARLRHGEGVWE